MPPRTESRASPPERHGILRPLGAAVGGWVLAGGVIGAWATVATTGRNDSIREVPDALAFAAWMTSLYAVALGCLGGLGQAALLVLSRGMRWPGAPSMAAHVLGCAVFCATATLLARAAYLPAVWPNDRTMRFVVIALVAAVALTAALMLLSRAQTKRGPRGLCVGLCLLAVSGVIGGFVVQGVMGNRRALPAFTPSTASPEWTGRRIFLIGVDGAEWSYIHWLKGEGRIPNIARLVDGGVRGQLRTTLPTYSPIIWTTIATGVDEATHGVRDFVELRLWGMERGVQRLLKYPELTAPYSGMRMAATALESLGLARQIPITGGHRRVKALWNIFSEHDVPVGVVNYFATYPAEPVHGFLVSDRFGFNVKFGSTAAPNAPGMVYPPDLAERLGAPLALPEGLARPEDFFHAGVDSPEGRRPGPTEYDILRIGHDTDRFAASAAVHILDHYTVEFLAVYLWGIDYNSHRLLKRFPSVIPRYYEYMDYLIGQIIARADEKTAIVLVSDHGWGWRPDEKFSHFHGPPGVIVLYGDGLRPPGELSETPHIVDVAPTVLALAGFPASKDMQGKVIGEALSDAVRARQRGHIVESYGSYHPPALRDMLNAAQTREGDAQAIERLRALGYVN